MLSQVVYLSVCMSASDFGTVILNFEVSEFKDGKHDFCHHRAITDIRYNDSVRLHLLISYFIFHAAPRLVKYKLHQCRNVIDLLLWQPNCNFYYILSLQPSQKENINALCHTKCSQTCPKQPPLVRQKIDLFGQMVAWYM